MNILITICARGGSKGIPNKNIRPLAGKPLIAHTIEQAKKWKRADKIVVSTDSPEIAAVARDFGADVPFMRPASLATDTSGKLDAIRHAAMESERIYQCAFDLVVDLDATAPLRTVDDLEKCYELFEREKPTTIVSIVCAYKNPYFNMLELNEKGYATVCKKPAANIYCRQDTPMVYTMNSSIYFYNRDYLMDEKNRSPLSDKTAIYEMGEISGVDVDREIDFRFIEFLLQEGLFSL